MRYQEVTGVVLAGGKSRRMGKDKAFLSLDGKPLVERVAEVLQSLFQRNLVITNTPSLYEHLGFEVYTDIFPGKGALGGIYTGLVHAGAPHAFFASCDMPFLNEPLIRYLVEERLGFDIVLPISDTGPEPIHAVYSEGCRPLMEALLREGRLAIHGLFPLVKVREVGPETLRRFDPDLLSFCNLNTPEELEKARRLSEGQKGRSVQSGEEEKAIWRRTS